MAEAMRNFEGSAVDFFQSINGIGNDLKKNVEQLAGIAENLRDVILLEQRDFDIGEFRGATQLQGAFKERLADQRGKLQRRFLSETKHIFDEIVGALRVLTNFSRHGLNARFGIGARGQELSAFADDGHGLLDLIGDLGNGLAESCEFFVLGELILVAIDAAVGFRKVLEQTDQTGGEQMLLEGKKKSEKEDGDKVIARRKEKI